MPGILLAFALPASKWTLVDARERRCALAESAVRAVGLEDRVEVRHIRAGQLARVPAMRGHFSGAAVRSFGQASELAECGLPLLERKAVMVVSVSAATERQWAEADLMALTGCRTARSWRTAHGAFLEIERVAAMSCALPRRAAARRRAPLF